MATSLDLRAVSVRLGSLFAHGLLQLIGNQDGKAWVLADPHRTCRRSHSTCESASSRSRVSSFETKTPARWRSPK